MSIAVAVNVFTFSIERIRQESGTHRGRGGGSHCMLASRQGPDNLSRMEWLYSCLARATSIVWTLGGARRAALFVAFDIFS